MLIAESEFFGAGPYLDVRGCKFFDGWEDRVLTRRELSERQLRHHPRQARRAPRPASIGRIVATDW